MNNVEIRIIREIQLGDLRNSYDLIILNRSFLYGLYKKLYIVGYTFEEFEAISYTALLKAAKRVDFDKLVYLNGYWKKYILHEYLQEKLRLQYQFSITINEYKKCKLNTIDPVKEFYSTSYLLQTNEFYETAFQADLRRLLWQEIDKILDEKNAYILWEIYYNERTMVSLAEELGIGAERIRRRKIRSFEKLRANKTIQSLAEHYFNIVTD